MEYACGCIDQFLEDFLNTLTSWAETDFHSHVTCKSDRLEGLIELWGLNVPCWVG